MITIKEIIVLVNIYGLKSATFISSDHANTNIEVRDGIAYFKQPCVENVLLCNLLPDEIDRIDKENDYYISDVWNDFMEEK